MIEDQMCNIDLSLSRNISERQFSDIVDKICGISHCSVHKDEHVGLACVRFAICLISTPNVTTYRVNSILENQRMSDIEKLRHYKQEESEYCLYLDPNASFPQKWKSELDVVPDFIFFLRRGSSWSTTFTWFLWNIIFRCSWQ